MDAGRKRCLPMWMLKRSAPEEPIESGNDESRFSLEGETKNQSLSGDEEAGEELAGPEMKKLDEPPRSFVQSKARKRSRKSGLGRMKAPERKAADNQNAILERSKQTINLSRPQNDMEFEALFLTKSEDDVELTMEDLVSIAEEYVSADEKKQQWQTANEESKSDTHISSSSIFSRNDFGVSCGPTLTSPQISKWTSPTTYGAHSSAVGTTECGPINISRTGDAAQDMLDVFLGPLLRVPVQKGDMAILKEKMRPPSREFNAPHTNDGLRGEVPSTKKNSLKDKVAVFLTDRQGTDAP